MSRVLVLNRNYSPVDTTSTEDAIKKVFIENAVIVLPPDEKEKNWSEMTWCDWSLLIPKDYHNTISTPSQVFIVPEIIKLNEYDKPPQQTMNLSRRALYKRDYYTCQYCGKKPGNEELSIDHIWPRSLGGKTEWTNVAIACIKCNTNKSNRPLISDPRSSAYKNVCKMKLLTQPIVPQYDVLKGRNIRVDSWQHFLGDCYWEIPLS